MKINNFKFKNKENFFELTGTIEGTGPFTTPGMSLLNYDATNSPIETGTPDTAVSTVEITIPENNSKTKDSQLNDPENHSHL